MFQAKAVWTENARKHLSDAPLESQVTFGNEIVFAPEPIAMMQSHHRNTWHFSKQLPRFECTN
jgi:hypothetical protein